MEGCQGFYFRLTKLSSAVELRARELRLLLDRRMLWLLTSLARAKAEQLTSADAVKGKDGFYVPSHHFLSHVLPVVRVRSASDVRA